MFFSNLRIFIALCLVSFNYGFETADLENIMMNLRQDKELTPKQSITLESLYKIYTINPKNLTILEDNIVFLSMEKTNKNSKKIPSLFKPEWQLYKRLDQNGYSLAIEEFTKDGAVHELASFTKDDKLPYVKWSENSLELIYSKGESPIRNVVHYDLKKSKSKSKLIVDSTNDDFSPIYGPNSESILFLSDRDKTHSRDKRIAIYVVFKNDTKRVYKLSTLSLIQENKNYMQERFFINEKEIVYFNENGKQTISLTKLSNVKKSDISATKIQKSTIKKIVSKQLKQNKSNSSEVIESKIWNEHEIRIKIKGDKATLAIRYPYEFKFHTLSTMDIEVFENLVGPLFVTSNKYLFYLRNVDSRFRVLYIKRGTVKSSALSDKRENCYSIFYDDSNKILYYILERGNDQFVVRNSIQDMKILNRISIESMLKLPGISPLFFEKGLVSYYSADGRIRSLDGELLNFSMKAKTKQKRIIKTKRKHLFSLEEEKAVDENIEAKKSPKKMDIDLELHDIVEKIRKITTISDLNRLKYRYSKVHRQVSNLSKNKSFVNNSSKKIKLIRWIELLNGIKVLLNQASILMEEE